MKWGCAMFEGLLTDQRWLRVENPRDVVYPAHEAFLHVPTQCVLIKLWVGHEMLAGDGDWWFEVRHPHPGWSRMLSDGPDLVARVEAAIVDLVNGVNNAR